MVGIQALGFLSVASELFFSTGEITCRSNSFLTSARISSRISPFNWNGCRQWNRSSSCASGEVVTPVEIGKATSSADLFARLSLVLKKLSLPRTYCASLDIGCKPVHQSPIAYNKLMKVFTQVGNLDEVLRLAQEMKESNCNPNVYCYNTVLNALVEANQPTLAEALFKEMLADDVAPDVASYNILVKLYSFYLKDFDSVYKVIAMMTENGFHPDLTTYCTLITGLCRAEKLKEAMDYLCLLLVEKIHVDAYIYTPIVQSYCSIGKIEDAKQLMNDMERLGYMPSCVTYNILIRALCKIGSFDEVENVLIESSSKGWKPDAITFNTYMDGLCKYGRAKEAYEKLDIMLINGICPGTVTLNILLDCLCHELRFSEAIFLLGQSFELGWYPGIVGYNTVMCRLSRSGKCLIVLKLFVDLLKNGISHNTKTLNIVINSLCNAGNVQQAKCFIDNRGFVANVTTYNTMVHWLFQMGKFNEAFQMLYDMHAEKITPDLITHTIIVHGLCKGKKHLEAVDYFLENFKEEFALDVYVSLISKLIYHSRYKEIFCLLDEMDRESQAFGYVAFCAVINTFCRKGFCHYTKIDVVCLLLDKMLYPFSSHKIRRQ